MARKQFFGQLTRKGDRLVPSYFSVCAVINSKDLVSSLCIIGRKKEKRSQAPLRVSNRLSRINKWRLSKSLVEVCVDLENCAYPGKFLATPPKLRSVASSYAETPLLTAEIWAKYMYFLFPESIYIIRSRWLINFSHYISSLCSYSFILYYSINRL